MEDAGLSRKGSQTNTGRQFRRPALYQSAISSTQNLDGIYDINSQQRGREGNGGSTGEGNKRFKELDSPLDVVLAALFFAEDIFIQEELVFFPAGKKTAIDHKGSRGKK